MALSGTHLETLIGLIKDAFKKRDLEILVHVKLGTEMYKDWVPDGQTFKADVYMLVTTLDKLGSLADFIKAVLAARPEREDLQAQLPEILSTLSAQSLTNSDNAAAIKNTVEGVASKMDLAPVRRIIMDSRGVLTELTGKIELLRAYKNLHDALHNVKMQFRTLDRSSRLMASDPDQAEDFGRAVGFLESQAKIMESAFLDLPSQPPKIREVERVWLDSLTAAITSAKQAARQEDTGMARQGVVEVRRILSWEPPRIDGMLSSTAEAIDLSKLEVIFSAAAALPDLAEDIAMLDAGRIASEQLLRQLKAQIIQHAKWQAIDQRLAGADDILLKASAEEHWDFDALWKSLKDIITALMATEPQSAWAMTIAAAVIKVEETRLTNDWKQLVKDFNGYRQEATVQFFAVDTNLKNLAGEVNKIGEPLRNLLNDL